MCIGKILKGRYKIIRQLGSGAFGDTYIAKDLDFPEQPDRVVKHLSPKNKNSQTLEVAARLFETEAKSLARLGEHDRIPRLFAYFEEDKEFYLVQELINGGDLTREFQSGKKWGEEKTVSFLKELLSILSVVHQQGTIHRDIKPANIMRRSDGKIILIDFGAVKEAATADEKGSTVAIGTLTYMPPEQAIGKPGTYSDVYAVGMLGIQALTGLSSANLPHDCDRFKTVLKQQQVTISSKLESVLCKMISYKPTERYLDATAAHAAIASLIEPVPEPQPIINPEPIVNPQSTPKSTVVVSKFHKKLLLGALGTIALISGIGVYILKSDKQPNYAQLETYLQNEQWQQADIETNKIILQVAKEDTALDANSIDNFPCDSLQKIDRLWTSNSDGRFGFTPQEQAYIETSNEFDRYAQSAYEAFGDRLGWRIFGVWSLYDDLKFTNLAPTGHLPSPGRKAADKNDLRFNERGELLSRFDSCGL